MTEVWRDPLSRQWLRFLIVGCLNTSFSYGVYALLLWFGLTFVWANAGALLLGILFSFRTQGRLVFGSRDDRKIIRFALCWGLIWLLNISFIAGFMRMGMNAYTAGAVALVPATGLSYLVQKFFVFAGGPAVNSGPPPR